MAPMVYPLYTLQSSIGQQWLMNTTTIKNQPIIDQQFPNYGDTPSLSGPISLLTLLNAINVAYRVKMSESKSDEEFKEIEDKLYAGHKITISLDEMLKYQDKYIGAEHHRPSMTLPQMEKLAMGLGFGTLLKFASPTPKQTATTPKSDEKKKLEEFIKKDPSVMSSFQTADQFKSFLCQKLSVRLSGIIANYDRSLIIFNNNEDDGRTKSKDDTNIVYGLVGACSGDYFLILDGDAQGPIWVHNQRLFEAMIVVDKKTGLPMGTLSVYELI